jgi:hypothetical protein
MRMKKGKGTYLSQCGCPLAVHHAHVAGNVHAAALVDLLYFDLR